MAYLASLERLLASAGVTGENGQRRVPFVFGCTRRNRFSSNKRLQTALGDEVYSRATAGTGAREFDPTISALMAQEVTRANPALAASLAVNRLNRQGFNAPVVMQVNATSLNQTQPKRRAVIPTLGGIRTMALVDRQGRANGVASIAMSGSTGTLRIPGAEPDDPEAVAARLRYQAWLSFYALTADEPEWIPETGEVNEFSAVIPSQHMPIPVSLIGHWERVHDITITAEAPFEIQWANTFVVHRTIPTLSEALAANFRAVLV